jgi:hypothetical protein
MKIHHQGTYRNMRNVLIGTPNRPIILIMISVFVRRAAAFLVGHSMPIASNCSPALLPKHFRSSLTIFYRRAGTEADSDGEDNDEDDEEDLTDAQPKQLGKLQFKTMDVEQIETKEKKGQVRRQCEYK